MKQLFFLLVCTTFFSTVSGQLDRGKTVQRLVNIGADTTRFRLLWELCEDYLSEKPDTSLLLAQQALALAQKMRRADHQASMLFTIGKVYKQKGDYSRALEYYNRSKSIYEEEGNSIGVAGNLLFIGEIYAYQGDYPLSLTYYFPASDLYRKQASDYGLAVSLLKISDSYRHLNKYDSAQYFLDQITALGDYKSSVSKHLSGFVMLAKAEISIKEGTDSQALDYYKQSLPLLQAEQAHREVSQVLLGIARLFHQQGKEDSSWHYARQSLEIARPAGFLLEVLNAAGFLAAYYQQQGNYREALSYLQMSQSAKDSLFSQEKSMAIQRQFYKEELSKQELLDRQQRTALLAASGVFLIIAFLLWRNNKQKQKANALLQQQKQEVQQALAELKAVQQQLIHSEKMASLGEVTAGIAHEIQNPLNFINNFSEISTELVAELREELKCSNTSEAMAILDDLGQSMQKINHHGNRADAIVKNMLQHSRQNAGEKLMVDVNAMVDEYLRLSYQAAVTKEKFFNATLETHFDKNIGQVNMVPQDMGRVLLNLFNNAFYAVREKAKKGTTGYEPMVQVSTRRVNGNFELRVRDNGTGIPSKAVEKIYQPFFTTKPTGEGTGLGLSMSYDIITKVHGGKMSVDTQEGEYAEFVVELPVH